MSKQELTTISSTTSGIFPYFHAKYARHSFGGELSGRFTSTLSATSGTSGGNSKLSVGFILGNIVRARSALPAGADQVAELSQGIHG